MPHTPHAITHTQRWIQEVVIGMRLCPFAAEPVQLLKVHYAITDATAHAQVLLSVATQCQWLDDHPEVETTLIILDPGVEGFHQFLEVVDLAQELIESLGYEGTYQLATFHPLYCFEGAAHDDAANYTNRSPYPMLHLLREESVERAIALFGNTEAIADRNILHTREKGLAYMQALRQACLGTQ